MRFLRYTGMKNTATMISVAAAIHSYVEIARPSAQPPERVPDGVIAVAGYFNRLLVICNAVWVMMVANYYLAVVRG